MGCLTVSSQQNKAQILTLNFNNLNLKSKRTMKDIIIWIFLFSNYQGPEPTHPRSGIKVKWLWYLKALHRAIHPHRPPCFMSSLSWNCAEQCSKNIPLHTREKISHCPQEDMVASYHFVEHYQNCSKTLSLGGQRELPFIRYSVFNVMFLIICSNLSTSHCLLYQVT